MQLLLSPDLHPDGLFSLSLGKPIIALSSGVNSAALLDYLARETGPERKPHRLLLY